MMRKFLPLSAVFCLFALHLCSASAVGVCTRQRSMTKTVYRTVVTYTSRRSSYKCGSFWRRRRCSRYHSVSHINNVTQQVTVYYSESYCCAEYEGTPPNCQPVCTLSCNNGGTCTAPDTCSCPPCWGGPTCNEALPPRATIPPPGTPTAGELFSLTCTIIAPVEDSLLGVQWSGPDGTIISSSFMQQNLMLTNETNDCTTYSTLELILKTSHGGLYKCKARSTAGNNLDTKILFVQIPPPTLTVSRDPDANTTLRDGDDLTLTCTIQLDDAVDSDVVVTGILQGPTGRNSTIVKTLDSPVQSSPVESKVYQIVLYIPSLRATSSETCTCTASVDPGTGVDSVQSSESHTDSIDITVELLVDVRVSYTPPPGFIPGPNEYRAASGPVIVTCMAVGGTGPVSYQWSSTCRDCPFQNSTSGSVYRAAVHSGDTGTHTCTATRGLIYGSGSISFIIVGAGIHVFNGTLIGSLPNNGIAIADSGNGFHLRLFCRSDSTAHNVGMLIGLDGAALFSTYVFDIGHPQPGELTVENRFPLTANDQGVYTCCIPLQSGEKRNINFGIYSSEFATAPSITHLEFIHGPVSYYLGFTHGPVSSYLVCTSTGSPPTTVTWMRDGQQLFLNDTYKLIQTLTDRSQSTYENVLIIMAASSDIIGHTYSCTVINTLGTISEALTAFPLPTVTISPHEIPTAGELFSLTCTVTLAEGDHLIRSTVHWMGSDVSMKSTLQVMNNVYISTLEFNPVRTSHGGEYICQATSTAGTSTDDTKFTVQIPPPTLTVSRDPDASTTLRHRDSLSLTCTIQLEEAVDSDVVVTGSLQGQARRSSTITTTSDEVYKIMLNIPSLRATPSEICTCIASVEPGPGVDFVQSSESHTDSLNITVELLVDVRVSYTPPPGFIPGPNEYRAASGPVIVTCIAVGGTGPVSYQWSSNCRDCPFQTATSRAVHRAVVNSADTGTHTCTATRGSGTRGSRSIDLNVVGAGIHVFRGILIGSLPNNGIAISHSSNGSRLCLFCRSDSMMRDVGMLIGPDGTIVTTGDVFDISHPQPGGLTVENKHPRNALTPDDQGVYTCRIPLQTGEERNINVGIYIIGFITAPSITHLGYTHGPISSNLTCISTGSPATTVTWMRDGQQLSLNDTYQLMQIVTDGRLSAYSNVLIIKAAASDIIGHTYSCTVINAFGTISKALMAFPPPTVTISPYEIPTAGELFSLTCTVTLAEGDHLIGDSESTIQWMGSNGVPMNSILQVMNNVYISTLEFNPVRTSHGGEYICQATSTAGTVMDDTKFTVQTPIECTPKCEYGLCVAPNYCFCNPGWIGPTCSRAICFPDCHRGDCIKPDECSCHAGYGGPKCAIPMCPPKCLNGGTCVLPGLCACPVGFIGSRCEIPFSF